MDKNKIKLNAMITDTGSFIIGSPEAIFRSVCEANGIKEDTHDAWIRFLEDYSPHFTSLPNENIEEIDTGGDGFFDIEVKVKRSK